MSGSNLRATRRALPSRLCIATSFVLYGASVFAGPSTLSATAQADHMLLPAGIYAGNAAGLTLVQDYGSLQLWQVDAAHRIELSATAGDAATLQGKAVLFDAGDFDPSRALDVPAAFGVNKGNGPQIHIVQLNGPTTDALMDQIQASGALIVAPLSGNAYAVLADDTAASRIVATAGRSPLLRAVTALPSFYKLSGGLATRAQTGLSPGNELDITVQIAKHGASAASKRAIAALDRSGEPLVWDNRLSKESLQLRIVESDLAIIANLPDVFAVEPRLPRRKFDEVQAQIVAGNFNATRSGPSGPGYRAWLQSIGFSTNPADHPIVDVVDDGLGNGLPANGAADPTLTRNGDGVTTRIASIANCTPDALGAGGAGHGHINANILGGYDARGDAGGIQTPFEDANGYLRGQGINPYVRLASTKIFRDAGTYNVSNCGNTDAGVIKSSQDRGAPITSNSWGASVGGNYDDSSEAYDIGTRDGDLTEAGVQPMIHFFAAGNAGSGAATVGSPGSGKNVITVGASENSRPGPDESGVWNDGCNVGASGANDARDIIPFSSRGPAEGSRIKPEVIAPGTHIQGTASTAVNYDGSGVCDPYRPTNQTIFAASSGTSHSAPAMAGIGSLVYRWLQTEHGITAPSAAMMKAYLTAFPTYLTGVGANDALPSNSQGYGMPNMAAAFDATTKVFVLDQTQVFGATGQTYTYNGAVVDPTKPMRLTLAWSDAPGAISDTTPQVNDLNLRVTVNGVVYTGNRFTGQYSTAGGGAADTANNYEAVFLPAGTIGPIVVTVTAFGIAGDGVPGNADVTDQDFALVCNNCSDQPDFVVSATPASAQTCGVDEATFSVSAGEFNNYDGNVTLSLSGTTAGLTGTFATPSGPTPFTTALDLDTTAALAAGTYPLVISGNDGTSTRTANITLQHSPAATVAPVTLTPGNNTSDVALRPTFTWNAVPGAVDYVLEVDNDPAFGSIDYTATIPGTSHQPPSGLAGNTTYYWRVRGLNNCGGGANSATFNFTTVEMYCVTPNIAIPDNNATGVTISLVVTNAAVLTDLDLDFNASHTYTGDIVVSLRHVGSNTTVTLLDRPGVPATQFGCSGDNPDLILDDEGTGAAETTCTTATPAYPVGARRTPTSPLTAFDGLSFAGTWQVTVSDRASGDTGTVNEWCLLPTFVAAPVPVTAVNDSFNVTEDTTLNQPAPGVLGNDTSNPPATLTAQVATTTSNGALTLNANGSFAYTPNANFCGVDTFSYIASNGAANSTPATVTLTVACVNDLPVAAADAYSATENQPLVVTAPGVLGNDTDVENSPLTAVLVTGTSSGTLALNGNGSFTYTPAANTCGVDTFTYRANDGTGNSAPATVTIDVLCVNVAPDAGSIDNLSVLFGTPVAIAAGDAFSDADGDALTFSATGLPPSLQINPATGAITGTPTQAQIGSYTITVTATDPDDETATAQFTLNVVGVELFQDGFED